MKSSFQIYPVEVVKREPESVFIRIDEPYGDELLGLEGFSHILVFW